MIINVFWVLLTSPYIVSSPNMSVKEERMSDAEDDVYSRHTIKLEPISTECEDQCSYSLIKVEKDSGDDEYEYILELEPCDTPKEERTPMLNTEKIVNNRESNDTDVSVKDEIEIGPTVIQPQYIGSSLHTTDASKAELIQCGGADVALDTTTPEAVPYPGNSTGSRSVVHCGTNKKEKRILKGNNFACHICEYKSAKRTNLVRHMCIHTGDKPFSCNICQYKCLAKSDLVTHMRIHTGEKPFSCNNCAYKCVVKSSLVSHMRTHTGEKPYSCNICQYKCKDKSTLSRHKQTHTGEKPFSCNICEYKCKVKQHLVAHMRTHTGEKPFYCHICEYKCKVKSSLVTHMRIHTGEEPFSCNICEYKCKIKSNLVRHMRIHTCEKMNENV